MATCYACEKGSPTTPQRECPECGYVFQGAGWGGIDAHWKSNHLAVMEYNDFWEGLCEAHTAPSDRRR